MTEISNNSISVGDTKLTIPAANYGLHQIAVLAKGNAIFKVHVANTTHLKRIDFVRKMQALSQDECAAALAGIPKHVLDFESTDTKEAETKAEDRLNPHSRQQDNPYVSGDISKSDIDPLWLLTEAELLALDESIRVTDINGHKTTQSRAALDLDTRYGYTAYGLRESEL